MHWARGLPYYINIAITDARENESLGFGNGPLMRAKILWITINTKLAESPLNEVLLQIRKQLNDLLHSNTIWAAWPAITPTITSLKGIALCIEGIAIARQMRLQPQLMMITGTGENYKVAGNTSALQPYAWRYYCTERFLNNPQFARQIAELEARNASQKNEKNNPGTETESHRKNYWLFGSAVFGVMA